MRIIYKVSVFFLLSISYQYLNAEPPATQPAVQPTASSPPITPQESVGAYRTLQSKADYEKCLEKLKEHVNNVVKPEYYEKIKIIHIDTKKEVKIEDMPEIQRYFIYLTNAEITSNMLSDLNATWEKKAESAPDRQGNRQLPNKADFEKYLKQVKELRKQHATQFEKLMDEAGEKFKADIPADEWKEYQGKVQNFHDTHKLIDRTK